MTPADFKSFSKMLSDVADYYRQPLAPAAIQVYWNALEKVELQVVRALLNAHVSESKFMPAVSELLDRIKASDGRPGPEEAWATIANDERASVVWTDEMAEAFGVANALIREGDTIAARLAFVERYRVLVRDARASGRPIRWTASLGHDPADRERALIAAQRKGLLTAEHISGLLPYRAEPPPEVATLLPDLSADRKPARRLIKDALVHVRAERQNNAA